jgi:hypothetical protein
VSPQAACQWQPTAGYHGYLRLPTVKTEKSRKNYDLQFFANNEWFMVLYWLSLLMRLLRVVGADCAELSVQ